MELKVTKDIANISSTSIEIGELTNSLEPLSIAERGKHKSNRLCEFKNGLMLRLMIIPC